MLFRFNTTFVLWSWPVARILLCSIIFLVFSPSSTALTFSKSTQFQYYTWLSWTAAVTLITVFGQQFRPRVLRALVAGDFVVVFFAMMLLRDAEEATIAFAVCVVVTAAAIGVKSKNILAAVIIFACLFLLHDFAEHFSQIPALQTATISEPTTAISHVIVLIAMFMVITSGSRKYRLKLFNREFSSFRTLAFEKSFQFDLQAWTDAAAALFGPQQAAYVVQGPTQQAIDQYHECNLPMLQKEHERQELMDALLGLQTGYWLYDTQLNRVILPETGHFRAFDENDQRIARVLRRADIRVALVQPLQIDRVRGGFICAVDSRIDAIIMAEASFLGRHVTEMTAYLGKVATAQRNFISDAHEVARRDLHDGVLQTLAALRMRLLLLTKRQDVAQQPIELEIRKAVDIVTLEQSRLRGFLESSETADRTVDLVAQLDICARTISLQWGIDITLKSAELAIPLDMESSFNIEHLLREVITNAVRHAKSTSLTVTLSLKQEALIIAVIDSSKPLDGPQVHEKPGLTLKSASLRNRLRLLNGEAYVEGLGTGTLLSIRIPMQQIEND
jgi:signal transduction histidine kinase